MAEGVPPSAAAKLAGYARKSDYARIHAARGTQNALVVTGVPLSLERIDGVVSDCLADETAENRLRAADLGYKRLGAYVQININLTGELVAMRGVLAERLADRIAGRLSAGSDNGPYGNQALDAPQSESPTATLPAVQSVAPTPTTPAMPPDPVPSETSTPAGQPDTPTEGGGDPPAEL